MWPLGGPPHLPGQVEGGGDDDDVEEDSTSAEIVSEVTMTQKKIQIKKSRKSKPRRTKAVNVRMSTARSRDIESLERSFKKYKVKLIQMLNRCNRKIE